MSYIISCSSPCDLSREHLEARNVRWIPFHCMLGERDMPDDLYQSISAEEFYQAMVDGADTRTSQVNTGEYLEWFEPMLKEGQDVLHIELSSGISGSAQSAEAAAQQLRPKYPERTLIVVDSLAASSGFGLLVDSVADRRDEGMDIHQAAQWAEENKLFLHHWFFSSDLTFYIKGGRVSKSAGFFGQMLGICPLLNVDYMGRLIPRDKIRPKKRVIREIVARMQQHAQGGTAYNGKCYISHSGFCAEDARAVADLVEAAFPHLNGKVEINDIGTTIGSHTGPGTVALFFYGDKRVD